MGKKGLRSSDCDRRRFYRRNTRERDEKGYGRVVNECVSKRGRDELSSRMSRDAQRGLEMEDRLHVMIKINLLPGLVF
jgi:hypothetical protein